MPDEQIQQPVQIPTPVKAPVTVPETSSSATEPQRAEAASEQQPPSAEEVQSMADKGFKLIDGAYRPTSRVILAA